jgi:hypothetical protein
MIKFFRKIRQNLLSEGKTGKYLKYAIGEIILVVIGILIALQINNLNNQRLANKQMNSFLQGIKDDLKSDELEFENRIQIFERVAEEKGNFLKLSNFDGLDIDSLYSTTMPRYSNYEINATTFDKIKSSGITQISYNTELSKRIYTYYNARAIDLKGFMDADISSSKLAGNYFKYGNNLFEYNFTDTFIERADEIVNFQDESIRKQNLIKLLSEPTGRNHIKNLYYMKYAGADYIGRLKIITESLITDIEKELNKK